MNWHNFFFNDTATTEIYTLSLHDALPISRTLSLLPMPLSPRKMTPTPRMSSCGRSEEHTSELQSHLNIVCRLLLEKKKLLTFLLSLSLLLRTDWMTCQKSRIYSTHLVFAT